MVVETAETKKTEFGFSIERIVVVTIHHLLSRVASKIQVLLQLLCPTFGFPTSTHLQVHKAYLIPSTTRKEWSWLTQEGACVGFVKACIWNGRKLDCISEWLIPPRRSRLTEEDCNSQQYWGFKHLELGTGAWLGKSQTAALLSLFWKSVLNLQPCLFRTVF